MRLKIFFLPLLLFLLLAFTVTAQKKGYVELSGRVVSGTQELDKVEITVLSRSVKILDTTTFDGGRFKLKFDVNKEYIVVFAKSGYASKRLSISTLVPEKRAGNTWKTQTGISLFEKLEGVDYSALDQPVARIQFYDDELGGTFTYDQVYSQRMDKALSEIGTNVSEKKAKETKLKKEIENLSSDAKKQLGVQNLNAEKQADSIVNDARRRASKIIDEAKETANNEAEKIVAKANLHKDDTEAILDKIRSEIESQRTEVGSTGRPSHDSRREADEIIRRAREEAKMIIDKAYEKAAAIVNDALIKVKQLPLTSGVRDKSDTAIFSVLDDLEKNLDFDFLDGDLSLSEQLDMGEMKAEEIEEKLIILEQKIFVRERSLYRAKLELELDKLKARTKQDSLLISEKEALIYKAEIDLLIAKQRIKESREKIKKQIMQIKQQFSEIKYQRSLLYLLVVALALVLVILFILYRNYLKDKKVSAFIEKQSQEINDKNVKLTSSILYARKIQDAFLPPFEFINNVFKHSFVLYSPRDIVSGDFYWVKKQNGKIYFTVVDCTGHGVPGAFMSIVGHQGLNRALNEFNLNSPNEILDKLNEFVVQSLQKDESPSVNDGMDIALCALNVEEKILEYSGAFNPLYIVREKGKGLMCNGTRVKPDFENESSMLFIVKPDKQPIAGALKHRKAFTVNKIELEVGDTMYLFTDGYVDQFGGADGKKFKYDQFRQLIFSVQGKSMPAQRTVFEDSLEKWRGEYDRVDDVCIFGITL